MYATRDIVHVGDNCSRPAGLSVVSGALTGWPLADVVNELAQHGVDAIEVTAGPGGHLVGVSAPALHSLVRTLDAADLRVCGVAATKTVHLEHDGLRAVLDIACALDARLVRIFAAPLHSDRGVDFQLDAATQALRALREYAPDTLELLIEPAPGTVVASPELARRILDASEVAGVGVVYDPASFVAEGPLKSDLAVEILGGYLKHVHVKNQVRRRHNGSWTAAPAPLDSGEVDWPATMSSLQRGDYRGWWSIDHLSGPPSAARLVADLRALRRLTRPWNESA